MNLIILPSIGISKTSDGRYRITQKFLDGVRQYAESWPGNVTVVAQEDERDNDSLDNVLVQADSLGFEVVLHRYAEIHQCRALERGSVVLASAVWGQDHIAAVCRSVGVPCVYVTEYSLATRLQIVNLTAPNAITRWRRRLWEWQQERKLVRAIRLAEGVQCNGTPTFESYRTINRNALLFFDTRVSQDLLATDAEVAHKAQSRNPSEPLQLLFSGRLIAMKGVGHLVEVAKHLRDMGVAYQLSICGDGLMRQEIVDRLAQFQLGPDKVRMMGTLDFAEELVPLVKKSIDVFLCCHLQGDPSCTYLETMACGVPILGYDNEAFSGVHKQSGAGWLVPMDPRAMAAKLAALSTSPDEILDNAYRSLRFAAQNTFENAFDTRISHLIDVAGCAGAVPAPRRPAAG